MKLYSFTRYHCSSNFRHYYSPISAIIAFPLAISATITICSFEQRYSRRENNWRKEERRGKKSNPERIFIFTSIHREYKKDQKGNIRRWWIPDILDALFAIFSFEFSRSTNPRDTWLSLRSDRRSSRNWSPEMNVHQDNDPKNLINNPPWSNESSNSSTDRRYRFLPLFLPLTLQSFDEFFVKEEILIK